MKKSKIVQMYRGRRRFTASAVAVAFLSLLPTWESGAVYGILPAKASFAFTGNSGSLERENLFIPAVYENDSGGLQQTKKMTIKGYVVDEKGEPMIGVSIRVPGTGTGTTTDLDGNFILLVPEGTKKLLFTSVGYKDMEIDIKSEMEVKMEVDAQAMEEVVVVGYGKQKKISVTGALSTIASEEVLKVSTPSLSNALAGQMPGIISRQTSGEPGYDQAQIYIRGIASFGNNNPLVLIDGVERDLNQINAQEVESFTILKDASATAVYGARGANGVILITTKRGVSGKPHITFRTEAAVLQALRLPKYVNGFEYASLMNEALRFSGQQERWSAEELQKYADGSDPYLYPNVDWADEVLHKTSWQTINNLSVTGGTDIFKYYMNVGFTLQDGLYREAPTNKYNTNANVKRYNFRSNIDVALAKNFTLQLGLGGIIQNGNYPGFSSPEIFKAMQMISPIAYPARNPDGTPGGSQAYVGFNPWGRVTQSGYSTQDRTTLQASFGANWNLDFLLKGLSLRGLFSYDRYTQTNNVRIKEFEVKRYLGKDPETGEDLYSPVFREEKPLGYDRENGANRAIYLEAQVNYNRTFGIHHLTGMLLFNQREYVDLNADSRGNIPYRRRGFAGRLTYSIADKYLLEGNFGYNGSENFPKGKRFGFFPSGSLGWIVSNENFWGIEAINRLKLRVSYGKVGNDQIGQRFLFLSTVNTDGQYYYFGDEQTQYKGMEENAIGNPNVTWEESTKTDVGFDLGLFNDKISLQVDFFHESRKGILLQRATIPQVTGIYPWSIPYGNIGKIKNKGVDALLEARNTTNSGFFYSFRGNFTFARNEVIENDEPAKKYPYLSGKGKRLNQPFGFVAEGFFRDEADIQSSPYQTLGTVRPGDVKYKDINGDGVIDSYDQVAIGYPRLPEISFGFGGTIGYKGFDLSVYFTGAAHATVDIGGFGMWAFYDGLGSNNILKEYYDNRWTPENPNARYPAIDVGNNPNNFVTSTVWKKNGNYLRFRNAEIGYTLKNINKKYGISQFRVFLNGMNLHTWDHVKIMDPESNDGWGQYPLQRSFNIGFQIDFN